MHLTFICIPKHFKIILNVFIFNTDCFVNFAYQMIWIVLNWFQEHELFSIEYWSSGIELFVNKWIINELYLLMILECLEMFQTKTKYLQLCYDSVFVE